MFEPLSVAVKKIEMEAYCLIFNEHRMFEHFCVHLLTEKTRMLRNLEIVS
jgi:hypothetical protein